MEMGTRFAATQSEVSYNLSEVSYSADGIEAFYAKDLRKVFGIAEALQ